MQTSENTQQNAEILSPLKSKQKKSNYYNNLSQIKSENLFHYQSLKQLDIIDYPSIQDENFNPNILNKQSQYKSRNFSHVKRENIPKLPLTLQYLPTDLIVYIAEWLTIKNSLNFSFVCKDFYKICTEKVLNRINKFSLGEQAGDITSLKYLLSRHNKIEYISIDYRFKIDNGNSGDISGNNKQEITDDCLFPLKFYDRSSIHSFIIRACLHITDIGYKIISETCNNLTVLNLSQMTSLSSTSLQLLLKANPRLVYLCLEKSFNAATDSTLRVLATHCPLIKTLSLSYCSLISDAGILYLAEKSKNIKELSLAHCYDISSHALCALTKACNQITVISLEWCFNVDDDLLDSLRKNCKNLQVLGIEHCSRVTDYGISRLVSSAKNLCFLSADSCDLLGSNTLRSIATSLHNIQDLYVNNCDRVNDEALELLVTHCTRLNSIGIEECNISDRAVLAITKHCRDLKVLGLNGNPKVTNTSVILLAINLSAIERLYISNTKITNQAVIAIATYSKCLISLSLVGCAIDYRGLIPLGRPENPCSYSLMDLHVSSTLQYARNFYGDSYKNMIKGNGNLAKGVDNYSNEGITSSCYLYMDDEQTLDGHGELDRVSDADTEINFDSQTTQGNIYIYKD